MTRSNDIQRSYDSAAATYTEHLFTELEGKPLDRHLLNRFAESVKARGLVADLGCGPGHVAKYLHDHGIEVCGIDLSPEMIRIARTMCPGLDFRVGDMLSLDLADQSRRHRCVLFHRAFRFVRACNANLNVIESAEREPYEGTEYPSRRSYIMARAA